MSQAEGLGRIDLRALAEALADVLLERGLLVAGARGSVARVLNAAQVGVLLGRDRHWVYAHARELGGFRFGDGPRARLGFDLAAVERGSVRISSSLRSAPRRGGDGVKHRQRPVSR